MESYYQSQFKPSQSSVLKGTNGKANEQGQIFEAKLKLLAVMKKLNINYNESISFSEFSLEDAIQ